MVCSGTLLLPAVPLPFQFPLWLVSCAYLFLVILQ